MRNSVVKHFATIALAGVAAVGVLFLSGEFMPRGIGGFVSAAEARLGAPLTPVSVAGTARRSVVTPVAGVGGPAGVGVGAPGVGVGATPVAGVGGPAGVGKGGPAGVGN